MNKRIWPWYIAAVVAELISTAFEAFLFLYKSSPNDTTDLEQRVYGISLAAIMCCAGVWLPILMGFIGKCFETKFKRLKAMPIVTAIPLAFSAFGLLWIYTHPRDGFMAGFQDMPRGVFYIICGVLSFFLFVAAVIVAVETKKEKYYDKFLAAPKELFEGKSVLWLIPLAVLTFACLIPAANGYLYNL